MDKDGIVTIKYPNQKWEEVKKQVFNTEQTITAERTITDGDETIVLYKNGTYESKKKKGSEWQYSATGLGMIGVAVLKFTGLYKEITKFLENYWAVILGVFVVLCIIAHYSSEKEESNND